jgi:hypothetical protein
LVDPLAHVIESTAEELGGGCGVVAHVVNYS